MAGKPWYNNGIIEIQRKIDEEIPDGFVKGRLPVSAEIKEKHSKNNGIHNLSVEKELNRRRKISSTKQSKSIEEKELYSRKLSESMKSKHIGNIPWNKGLKGSQVAWNKGLTYKLSESSKNEMLIKRFNTQKENGTLGINQDTSIEIEYYKYLLSIYDKDDIIRQYFDKDRYPYKCDFYIKSEDKFIEVHGNWTHGKHPFDENNKEDIKILELWKEKAKTSDFYKNAIYQWTDLDVRKKKTAENNNLNFEAIYP